MIQHGKTWVTDSLTFLVQCGSGAPLRVTTPLRWVTGWLIQQNLTKVDIDAASWTKYLPLGGLDEPEECDPLEDSS